MLVRRAFPAARQRFAHPFQFLRSVPGRKFDRRADEGMYHRTSTESRGLRPVDGTGMKLTMAEAEKTHSYKKETALAKPRVVIVGGARFLFKLQGDKC